MKSEQRKILCDFAALRFYTHCLTRVREWDKKRSREIPRPSFNIFCSKEAIRALLTNPSLSGERMSDNGAVPSSVPLRRARQLRQGMPS